MTDSSDAARAPFAAADLEHAPALYVHSRRVRFQEIDAAGIVFFARVFEYFHDAYVEFLRARGVEHADVFRERRWGAPLVHAEADYRAPLYFGDEVEVHVVRAALGASSMRVGYRLAGPRGIHALGQTVQVFVSMSDMSRQAVPADVRASLGGLPSAGGGGGA